MYYRISQKRVKTKKIVATGRRHSPFERERREESIPPIFGSGAKTGGLFATLRDELDLMVQAVADQEDVIKKCKESQATMMAEVAAMHASRATHPR